MTKLDQDLRNLKIGEILCSPFPEDIEVPFMISYFKKRAKYRFKHWIDVRKEDGSMETCHQTEIWTD